MALREDVKDLLESLVIDGDADKARDAAYRVAAHEAMEDGPGKAFCNEVIRAYRLGNGTGADETVPEEVSQLVFMEHPEELRKMEKAAYEAAPRNATGIVYENIRARLDGDGK